MSAKLDMTFAALADPTRRAVIKAVLRQPMRAGDLAVRVNMSAPALSRHLRVLRKARLIVEAGIEDDARVRLYSINPAAFAPVRSWLDEAEVLWSEQLNAFKLYAVKPRSPTGRAK